MLPALLIGALGPPVLSRNTQYATDNLPSGRNLYNGFYKITSDPVLLFQKEIWFSAVIHREKLDRQISIPLTVNISILCRMYPDKIKAGDDHEPDAGDVIAIEKYQKNVTLVCMEGKTVHIFEPCNEIPLIHIGQLKCAAYTFKVRFLGLLAQKDDSDVKKIRKSQAVHPKATSSAQHHRRIVISSVEADDDSNITDDENAIDYDVGVDNSIEDTNGDVNDNQSSNNEGDNSKPNRDEKKSFKKGNDNVKISVADDIADEQFGPVMEEENKETNNPVIPNFAIKEIEFITQTRNPTFSYFELFSRVAAFLAAFGLFFVFFTSMNVFGWELWTVEQKWTSMILLLLLFYYDWLSGKIPCNIERGIESLVIPTLYDDTSI
ncbi:hypothetical protein ACTXT7_007511 [Hymenolepis weldensis]